MFELLLNKGSVPWEMGGIQHWGGEKNELPVFKGGSADRGSHGEKEIYGLVLGMNGAELVCVTIPAVGGWRREQELGSGVTLGLWAGPGLDLPSPCGSLGCPEQAVALGGWAVLTRAVGEDVGTAVGAPGHTGVSWASKGELQPKNPKLHWGWICSTAGEGQ